MQKIVREPVDCRHRTGLLCSTITPSSLLWTLTLAARIIVREHNLAQQGVEKYLKALLVSRQQAFPRTHDVVSRCTTYVGGMASISLSIRTSQSAYPHMRSKYAIQGKSPPQTKPGKRCRLRRQCADRPEQYCGHLLGNRNFCGVASGRWLGKTRASGGGSAVHVSSNDTLACHGGHTR